LSHAWRVGLGSASVRVFGEHTCDAPHQILLALLTCGIFIGNSLGYNTQESVTAISIFDKPVPVLRVEFRPQIIRLDLPGHRAHCIDVLIFYSFEKNPIILRVIKLPRLFRAWLEPAGMVCLWAWAVCCWACGRCCTEPTVLRAPPLRDCPIALYTCDWATFEFRIGSYPDCCTEVLMPLPVFFRILLGPWLIVRTS
jgi:hypothetical protein